MADIATLAGEIRGARGTSRCRQTKLKRRSRRAILLIQHDHTQSAQAHQWQDRTAGFLRDWQTANVSPDGHRVSRIPESPIVHLQNEVQCILPDTAGCKHDFSNWTVKIFHRWILYCGDLLQSIILHTGAEKIIFSLYFPKQKQDWNQDQRETWSHISFPPIQGWTLTSGAGHRYCSSVLRTYELCMRGWREEEDGGEGQRQGQGGDEQVLSRIKPWGWKLLNPNWGKQAERHRHKSWAEYNWLKFHFRQATGKDSPLLWVWAHAVCW